MSGDCSQPVCCTCTTLLQRRWSGVLASRRRTLARSCRDRLLRHAWARRRALPEPRVTRPLAPLVWANRAFVYSPRAMRTSSLLALAASGCIAAPPIHPRARESNDRCSEYLAQGDLSNAEVQCDLGLEFSPTYADLWVNKGLIAFKRDQLELAKDHFIKAIRYNQDQAQAYNNLGIIDLREVAYGNARDNFRRALEVNPDYREARYNLGLAYYYLGRREDAKKQFRTAVALAPEVPDAHKELGMMALEDGDLDMATAELQQAVERDPRFAAAWLYLGVAHAKSGRYQAAKSAFEACLAAEPNNPDCRRNAAAVEAESAAVAPGVKGH